MQDRSWLTVSFPTPLIFRYHLPLKYSNKHIDELSFTILLEQPQYSNCTYTEGYKKSSLASLAFPLINNCGETALANIISEQHEGFTASRLR
jgi:hypothetical protein